MKPLKHHSRPKRKPTPTMPRPFPCSAPRPLFLVLLLAAALPLLAQSVAGRVTNQQGQPVPYAYIYLEDARQGTQADAEGRFALPLPAHGSHTLVASCVGYRKARRPVAAGDTAVRLVMKADGLLDAVTITATRTPKTLASTPVVTRIISQQDIALSDATNISGLLQAELPGLEFTRSMNQQLTLSLQGMGGMSVLFLVDGERMAGETLDNTDLARISLDNIERVEIVKGAATALYGSNAVAAVVNIITKSGSEPWTAQISSRLGSRHGERRHAAAAGLNKGPWGNQLNVQNDGMRSHTLVDSHGDSTLVYGNRQWNAKDKLTYAINDHARLTARGGYYFHEREDSRDHHERARAYSAGLRYDNQWGKGHSLEASYAFDRYDKSNQYPLLGKEYIDYKNTQHTLRALYSRPLRHGLTATLGGDAMNDYLMTYQFANSSNHHSQQTADLFLQADWWPTAQWNIVGGLRADYFSEYGLELTPKAALMLKAGHATLRASYGKGFRAPTLKELYMDFNMANIFKIYGNESLQSETSHCFALSAEYGTERLNASLTGTLNRLHNQIGVLWDPSRDAAGAMVYTNIDGTDLGGLDATLSARLGLHWSLKVSYAYFHEFPRGNMPNTSDTRPHSAIAQVAYNRMFRHYSLHAMLSGRLLSKARHYVVSQGNGASYDTYEPFLSPGYTLWRLTTMHRLRNAITLTVGIDNLLNYKPKTYAYNSPYTQGITLSVGLAVDLHNLPMLSNTHKK